MHQLHLKHRSSVVEAELTHVQLTGFILASETPPVCDLHERDHKSRGKFLYRVDHVLVFGAGVVRVAIVNGSGDLRSVG